MLAPQETEEADDAPDEDHGEACDPGPYDIEPGDVLEIELDLEAGETLTGNLDGDDSFTFEIVNERNLVLARRGEDFTAIRSGDDETAYSVRWKAKGRGPWYLRLSAPRKQVPREIHVVLRRHR